MPNARLKKAEFRILFQTDRYIAGHEYEYAYLIDNKTNKEVYMGGFYGDPCCAIIDNKGTWCVFGGETINILVFGFKIAIIDKPELKWVMKLRQTGNFVIELLIDPWSEYGAVWQLDVRTLESKKLRPFDLSSEPNTADIDW